LLNVVVTGGSRGLGLGIAAKLAESGFCVIAIARNATEQLETAAAEVAAGGEGALHFEPFDLAEINAIPDFVKTLRKKFGGLYGLVNNAGIGTSGVLANMPDSAIETLIRLNVLSPIALTKYVARSMMTGQGGRIVNLSSVVAVTGYNGLSVYSATKASLMGFTRSLARELGPLGITVNAVAPGFISTEMTNELKPGHLDQIARRSALKRMAEIDDVANAVDYLFSDKAKNITGTQITVDAGNTA
jgi:3-oxoacyl-[acyl-carrier protein] reductase